MNKSAQARPTTFKSPSESVFGSESGSVRNLAKKKLRTSLDRSISDLVLINNQFTPPLELELELSRQIAHVRAKIVPNRKSQTKSGNLQNAIRLDSRRCRRYSRRSHDHHRG